VPAPAPGTPLHFTAAKTPTSPFYGSFGRTNLKPTNNEKKTGKDEVDNDSGMSSEENDDSLKLIVSASKTNNISSNLDKCEVITKCLPSEPSSAERWNEIPCCSTHVTNVSVIHDVIDKTGLNLDNDTDLLINNGDNKNTDFIVIDLTCDVNARESVVSEELVDGTNGKIDCDQPSIHNVGPSQSLVPVNNEIVSTESQKLVSLSLSILLAALLQAMRCFAQFLEDIVIPQR
jgi:hypothetical protein